MRAYCEEQQNKGILELNLGKPDYIQDDEYSIITTACSSAWLTDYEMQAYCQSEEYSAITTLNQLNTDALTRADCANQWPTDFGMRLYCEQN